MNKSFDWIFEVNLDVSGSLMSDGFNSDGFKLIFRDTKSDRYFQSLQTASEKV
jgi:hypothetical protein